MMKFLPGLVGWSVLGLMPVAVDAAGTYYTGNYQSPQVGYAQRSYAQRNQNTNYSAQGVSAYNRNQYAKVPIFMNMVTEVNIRKCQLEITW